MVTRWMRRAVVSFVLVLAGAVAAGAQPLGTFRWQQQPYCNILTLNVVQSGAIYHLDGYDDQCGGAARRASVVGIAFLNPDGSVGIGLTLVTTPGGTPLHIDVTLSLATISGTWQDSAGNTGPFVLTPGAGVPGSPRPTPQPRVLVDRPFHTFVICAGGVNRFAVVSEAGTFVRGSAGTTASRLTTGTYVVSFDINVTTCSWQVTVGQTGSVGATTGEGNVAGRSGNVNGLFITTRDIS